MDAITVTAASAVTGAVATAAAAWLQARRQRQQAREESRRDHLDHLPPGSRVVDLGEHGVVIEVGGSPAAGARNDRDAPR